MTEEGINAALKSMKALETANDAKFALKTGNFQEEMALKYEEMTLEYFVKEHTLNPNKDEKKGTLKKLLKKTSDSVLRKFLAPKLKDGKTVLGFVRFPNYMEQAIKDEKIEGKGLDNIKCVNNEFKKNWCKQNMADFLIKLAIEWKEEKWKEEKWKEEKWKEEKRKEESSKNPTIMITSLSDIGGGPRKRVGGHKEGIEVDIRPFRNDKSGKAVEWVKGEYAKEVEEFGKPIFLSFKKGKILDLTNIEDLTKTVDLTNEDYDRKAQRRFFELLKKLDKTFDPLFNDYKLITFSKGNKSVLCKWHSKHDNHVHIRLKEK